MLDQRGIVDRFLAEGQIAQVTGFAGITWQWQEATTARDIARAEEREKELERLQAVAARADDDDVVGGLRLGVAPLLGPALVAGQGLLKEA